MKYYTIGKITNTHGLKGEIKVKSDTDFADLRYKKGNEIFIFYNNEIIPMIIKTHRVHKKLNMLTFEGIDNINDVEKYKNSLIKIPEDQLTELEEDEFYFKDLIGLEVYNEEEKYIGVVKDIRDYPQGEILVVKREKLSDGLIPFNEVFIIDVTDKIIIHEMDGLL